MFPHQKLSLFSILRLSGLLTCLATALPASESEKNSPPPRMPSPNAFNFYIQAGELLVDSDAIAKAALVSRSKDKKPTLTALQAIVTQNARALKLLRLGFQYPYRHPVVKDAEAPMPEYSQLRNLARLLVVEGEIKKQRGDQRGAANNYLEGIRLGLDLPHGGNIPPLITGWACETISRWSLWEILTQLDAPTAHHAIQQLEELADRRIFLADALQEEKRIIIASIPKLIQRSDDEDETTLAPYSQQITDNISAWMDETIGRLRLPYRQQRPVLIPIDAISQQVLPMYNRNTGFNEARNLTDNALLTVALALRAYNLEHNRYPQSLNELSPGYLKQIPLDPFANNELLRYKLTGNKYHLYSIGPDGVDDGGRAIEDTNRPKHERNRFAVMQKSQGDFVAGTNY